MNTFDEQFSDLVRMLVRLTDDEGQPLYDGDEARKLARKIMIGGRSRDDRRFQAKQEPVDGRWICGDGVWHRSKKIWAEARSPLAFTYCRKGLETYLVDKSVPPMSSVCPLCEAAWKASGKPEPA